MVNPFELLAQGVVGLFNHFTSVIDYLNPFGENFILKDIISYINPFSDNFILKGVLSFLGNIVDYINPFSDNFILKGVLEFLGNLVSYVNPFSENFLGRKLIELFSDLFKKLFIPTGKPFDVIIEKFNGKFAFVEQIKELVNSLFNTTSLTSSDTARSDMYSSFKMTYVGYTFTIFDLTWLEPYRGSLHTLIIAVAYIAFALRLYKRLPGIIQGFTIS